MPVERTESETPSESAVGADSGPGAEKKGTLTRHEPDIVTERIYYHYCSVEAMLSILETKKMRLSSAYAMNDPRDVLFGVDFISEMLHEPEHKELLEAWDPDMGVDILQSMGCHLACFSAKDDVLSQWRAYADNGRGVTIGFRWPDRWKAKPDNEGNAPGFQLGKVEYKPKRQRAILRKTLRRVHKKMEEAPSEDKNLLLLNELFAPATMMKHEAFAEEREWRIALAGANGVQAEYQVDIKATCSYTYRANIEGPQFRASPRGLIDYYTLGFSQAAIHSVTLGPACRMSVHALTALFHRESLFDTEIYASSAAYEP